MRNITRKRQKLQNFYAENIFLKLWNLIPLIVQFVSNVNSSAVRLYQTRVIPIKVQSGSFPANVIETKFTWLASLPGADLVHTVLSYSPESFQTGNCFDCT